MNENKHVMVSFCLPVFNVREYVRECIDSIVSQGLENYEILCIDDYSTDGSYEELLKMERIVSTMRVLRNDQNQGVSYTRNRLMEEAKGEFIWFVDPDDILYPNCVRNLIHIACKTHADVCLANYLRFAEDEVVKCEPLANTTWRIVEDIEHSDYLPIDSSGTRMNSICAGCFRKDFLTKNNLCFCEGMISQEDTLFYYEFQVKSTIVVKCDFPCYLYRQRETSVMHIRTTERNKKYYQSMCKMREVFQRHLNSGDFRDKDTLLYWLEVMKQNIAFYLAIVDDDVYVREQMRDLKARKLYPYPMNKRVLRGNESYVRRLCKFLLPIEPVFWIVHLLIAKLKIVKF